MQNSFEKQVQEKMDELQFVPTEPVWQNIEKQIRTKKDRRRLILWLPFLFLLLGGGAWWFTARYQNADSVAKTGKNSETVANTVDGNPNHRPAVNAQYPGEKERTIVLENGLKGQKQVTEKDFPESNDKHRIVIASLPVKTKSAKPSALSEFSHKLPQNALGNEKDKAVATVEQGKKSRLIGKDTGTGGAVKTDTALNKSHHKKDSSATKYKVAELKTDSANTAIAEPVKVDKSKAGKWQFAILANAGISGLSKGFGSFGFGSFREEKALQDANYSPGSGSPSPVYDPSPVKNNLSFSAGVSARKEVTKRLAVVTGLQYNYYSTNIAVGQMRRQDTTVFNSGFTQSVSRFYLNSGTNFTGYRNHYHFITLPFSVEWSVWKKAPLYLQAGLSVQHIISTNALIFDKSSRIYYEDKNAFNKTQLFSSFGLSYAVFKRSKTSLLIGPQLQYGISDLEKNTSGKHLFSLGLTARFLFHKK